MLISHMSEDNETYFKGPWAGPHVQKGLKDNLVVAYKTDNILMQTIRYLLPHKNKCHKIAATLICIC